MTRFDDLFTFDESHPLIFTQLDFWIFFLLVLAIFSYIHKYKLTRSIFLFVASLFFYFKTSGLLVLLLFSSIVINYFIGKGVWNTNSQIKKKGFVTLSVLFNILTLGYFKYAYFFTESFNKMFHTKHEVFNVFAQMGNSVFGEGSFVDYIVLPVGVSFFTFQSISYVVDIYRKEVTPVKNFFDYAFFVSFFPQLVAGPIVRARDFIPQISQPFKLNHTDFSWSIIQIAKGFIKKIVLADYIAIHFIDKVVDAPEAFPGFISILAMWGYSLQIYGDFSGYTDIAIGVSRLMGFRLLENFNSPYKAISVADFWRRWHKSLGSWLRDYLYIPLGGSRGGSRVLVISLMGTMLLGGLWHGASWNFVLWGAMHGILLLCHRRLIKLSQIKHLFTIAPRFTILIGWFVTQYFIFMTWLVFRVEDTSMMLRSLKTFVGYDAHWDFYEFYDALPDV